MHAAEMNKKKDEKKKEEEEKEEHKLGIEEGGDDAPWKHWDASHYDTILVLVFSTLFFSQFVVLIGIVCG